MSGASSGDPVAQAQGSSNSIAIKFLPLDKGGRKTVDDFLRIWPDAIADPLPFLAERLNEDRGRAFVRKVSSHGRDEIYITTPRFRLACFPDRYDDSALVVKRINLANGRIHGVPFTADWTACSGSANGTFLKDLISSLDSVGDKTSPEQFWEFWASYLDRERELVDKARAHPGWEYIGRRWGLNGAIDFRIDAPHSEVDQGVPDEGPNGAADRSVADRSGIESLIANNGRVSVETSDGWKSFDVLPYAEQGWLSARPVWGNIRLEHIKDKSRVYPDWQGQLSLFKRRYEALQRLRVGGTCLPSLNSVLPDGPKDDTPTYDFSPVLPNPYSADQREAISKALAPETLSTILGPPGTGKTTVIAEIAAQTAKQGGRTLIASQTNLAVDNALEKLKDAPDYVFAVRVGNPQSTKLGQFLIDRAGERCRERILDRSRRALDDEEAAVAVIAASVPSQEELEAVASGAIAAISSREALKLVTEKLCMVESAVSRATVEWEEKNRHLRSLLASIGLSEQALPKLLAFGEKANSRGWNLSAPPRVEQLEGILPLHDRVTDLEVQFEKYQEMQKTIERSKAQEELLEQRIGKAQRLEQDLATKKAANTEIDNKLREAKTFLQKVGTWFLSLTKTPQEELDRIAAEIRRLDRRAAERDRSELSNLRLRTEKEFADLELRVRAGLDQFSEIGIDCVSPSRPSIDWLRRILNDAIFADKHQAFGLLEFLPHFSALSVRVAEVELSAEWMRTSGEPLLDAQAACKEATATYQRYSGQAFLQKLGAMAEQLGIQSGKVLLEESASQGDVNAVLKDLQGVIAQHGKRTQRLAALTEALGAYHCRLEDPGGDFEEAVLHDANVIAATCTGIAGAKDFDTSFDRVVIDEAGRATPLDLLIPMVRGESVTLVGDHFQLPPMMDPDFERDLTETDALNRTLFQRLFDGSNETRKHALSLQYRMDPRICDLVKQISYKSVPLETAAEVRKRPAHPFGQESRPIHWIKCMGRPNRSVSSKTAPGIRNEAEVAAAVRMMNRMAEILQVTPREEPYAVGVIAMYRQQVDALEKALKSPLPDAPFRIGCDRATGEYWIGSKERQFLRIELGTVDSFQGREKDAIIVSLVETNPRNKRFFYDARRLNVALSRAREFLVLVGELDVLGANPKSPNGGNNPIWELHNILTSSISVGAVSREIFNAD